MKSKTLRKIYFLIASLFSFCGTLVAVGVFFEDTSHIWAFDGQEHVIRKQMECEREKKYALNNPEEYN